MTKRYFITDPLQAAMAARDFGFRFRNEELNNFAEMISRGQPAARPFEELASFIRKYIYCQYFGQDISIHPDSEHLLQPQEGDLISVNGGLSANQIIYKEMLDVLNHPENIKLFNREPQIIQRNNKPFSQFESRDI